MDGMTLSQAAIELDSDLLGRGCGYRACAEVAKYLTEASSGTLPHPEENAAIDSFVKHRYGVDPSTNPEVLRGLTIKDVRRGLGMIAEELAEPSRLPEDGKAGMRDFCVDLSKRTCAEQSSFRRYLAA